MATNRTTPKTKKLKGDKGAKSTGGRPTLWSDMVKKEFCRRLALGRSAVSVCEDADMPSYNTLYDALSKDENFQGEYARAKELRAEAYLEELSEIADDGRNDWMTIKRGNEYVEVPNREVLERSKLRVQTRQWIMSKMLPRKYGDKLDVNHGNQEGKSFNITISPTDAKL
jgi:hypothetical protein